MKYLSVIVWLLLGILYYWLWSSNISACCGADGISSTEQVAPLQENKEALASTEEVSAEDKARADAKIEADAKEKADKEAEAAIAAAEKTKEVTSVKSKDASGANKLTFYFPHGSQSAEYASGTQSDLKELVELAKSSGKKIVVSGHTDSSSSDEFNMKLGKRRADKVRTKIIALGLPGNQVISESFGERKPIASNDTEEGMRKNRRVELIIQ